MKRTKSIIIISVLLILLLMSIAYSAFETQLNLNTTSQVIGEWDVKITNIEAKSVSANCDPGLPQFTNTTMEFDAKLNKPGDIVEYEVTIKNEGTIDAILNNIFFFEEEGGSSALNYITTQVDPLLVAGEQTKFSVMVEYLKDVKEIPSVKHKALTGIIEYVQER